MTRERAKELALNYSRMCAGTMNVIPMNLQLHKDGSMYCPDVLALFEQAILAAVAEERERCADICDQHASVEGIAQKCAKAIRAGGE